MTRPLSSGRPPSATPTPNGHAPQPAADCEQDDQVGLTRLSFMTSSLAFVFLTSFSILFYLSPLSTYKSSCLPPSAGAGAGAAGLCGCAGG